MSFRSKTILLSLIFVFYFFIPILQAAESAIPLPSDAIKISEKGPMLGPMKSVHRRYRSSWDKNKLQGFYKKEMQKSGWKESKNLTFRKDDGIAIVTINPYKDRGGKTSFSVAISKVPTEKEILAMRKKNPDKLNFMPSYPGSEQVSLWNYEDGLLVKYETEDGIKNVVFFYKSGMLNYGWQLDKEVPIRTEADDCPGCKKLALTEARDFGSYGKLSAQSRSELTFRRNKNETCVIRISSASFSRDNVSVSKTTISASYRENKPNKLNK